MQPMDENLWPARNVAEYAYCPRLFYFMEVEGIFLPSADTEQGVAVHRRVDKPSADPADEQADTDPTRPKTIRKLTLSSKQLGLTATLDLTELTGDVAVPVEYRKGRPKRKTIAPPPDDPSEAEDPPLAGPEPWPTDRIQVGLQSYLLREAGYQVNKAILYYAAEKLRLEITVDESLLAEALSVLEAAKRSATGPRPLPLLNDPRCMRCSLQPICLPDEINQQRSGTAVPMEEVKPRKIWPPHDDGIHIVAQQQGAKIGVKGAAMTVSDRDGRLVKEVPLANVDSVSLLGSVQISTQAVHVLADRGIPIAYLSAAGRLIAMVDPLDSVSAAVRLAQARKMDGEEIRVELSRALITAKITNQRTLLMRNHSSVPDDVAGGLARAIEQTKAAPSVDSVRGQEGYAAAVYFQHFAGMIKGPLAAEFHANGRQRRPPPDPINACLSLAYSMLTHECVAALRLARLEPSIGAYHVSRPGRPALALDLMEPFRPIIADSIAITAFNRGELTEGHFFRSAAGCMFTDAGRKIFFKIYAERLDTEITHPVFGYRLSYRRMLQLHARMIAAWLMEEVPSLAFLTTR
jgi:CRISPR-associated protein Cas1